MPSRQTWALTGLACLGGAIIGGALLVDGPGASLFGAGPTIPLRIFVSNAGPYAANISASLALLGGQTIGEATYALGAGSERTDSVGIGSGEFHASVSADRGGIGTNTHQGTTGVTGKTSKCSSREALVFEFTLDTARGISFTSVRAACR